MRVDGSRVLVTGVTGGLGQAIAATCVAHGAQLLVTGRDESRLAALRDALGACVYHADLTDRDTVVRLASEVGDVDILVSNAALPGSGRVETFTVDEIDRVLDVNLRAGIVLGRLLAPSMVERGHGHIVFVSSLAAAFPTPQLSLYNDTKAALRMYGLSLRAELASTGVGVSIVYPGPITQAGMWADSGLKVPIGLGTKTPADVADGVVRAIERNRAEVNIAGLPLRLAARLSQLSPATVASLAPRIGSTRIVDAMADAHRAKR